MAALVMPNTGVTPTPTPNANFLSHRPSYVTYKNYRFLIMDAPTDNNLLAYIEVRFRSELLGWLLLALSERCSQ